jgi:molybdopterin molybdotransferase
MMTKEKSMIALEEALGILDESLKGRRLDTESIPVREAAGRVLAEDQLSLLDLPPFNKSAMDGYAILEGDERDEYRLLETVAAGYVESCKLSPGTTIKVMTGAPVPPGTGRVVMVEDTREEGGIVRVLKRSTHRHICDKGEDLQAGQKIFSAGARLGALDVANLVGCGITRVPVYKALRVFIISTGDEIADSPGDLSPGRIMNVNGPLLSGLSAGYGLHVAGEASAPDTEAAIREALKKGLELSDVAILSGGISAGDFDFVPRVLQGLGFEIAFSRVAVKPGKPIVYAGGRDKLIFALPGNPVSVYLTFHLYVIRAARILWGSNAEPRRIMLPLKRDFSRRSPERCEFVPCRIDGDGRLEALKYHGSAHLAALGAADGFFIVPAGVSTIKKEDVAALIPMNGRITA